MTNKVYVSGNYFIIETPKGDIYTGLAKDVVVSLRNIQDEVPSYRFYNVTGWSSFNLLELPGIADESGTPYTKESFKEFYESSTGKYSAGTSASPTEGIDGASAYEIAVENGFEGTEEDWLNSLIGPQGPEGPMGPMGPEGPAGPKGEDGADGKDGINGVDGTDGKDGSDATVTKANITSALGFTPKEILVMTQAEYDAITPDEDIIYVIQDENN